MKIFAALVLLLALSFSSFGSPLVFKTLKTVENNDLTELTSLDTSKLKQIRMVIKFKGEFVPKEEDAKKFLSQSESNYNQIKAIATDKNLLETVQNSVNLAKEVYEKSKGKNNQQLSIFSVEGIDEILIQDFYNIGKSHSFIIDTPPSKISIKVANKGEYTIYIYGQ